MIPNLEGLGSIKTIVWKDGKAHIALILEGMEDREINITCNNISISPDGGEISASGFTSNMPFMENALNRFASGSFKIADEEVREAVRAAKILLGIK